MYSGKTPSSRKHYFMCEPASLRLKRVNVFRHNWRETAKYLFKQTDRHRLITRDLLQQHHHRFGLPCAWRRLAAQKMFGQPIHLLGGVSGVLAR